MTRSDNCYQRPQRPQLLPARRNFTIRGAAHTRGLPVAWRMLLSCSLKQATHNVATRLVRYGCASDAYMEYLERLSADTSLAPLELGQLQLPPGTRTLFFGNSFTREIVDNLLCAGGLATGHATCTTIAGAEYPPLPSFNSWAAECKLTRQNATLVAIINDPFLQAAQGNRSLEALLARQGGFDYTFYTKAHPGCWHSFFEEWISSWRERRAAAAETTGGHGRRAVGESVQESIKAAKPAGGPCWVDLAGSRVVDIPPTQRDLSRDRFAWQQLRRHSRRGIWEVSLWSQSTASAVPRVSAPREGSTRAAELTASAAGLAVASFYDAGAPVRAHPCHSSSSSSLSNSATCRADANGHQCLVSGVTEVARQLVARAKEGSTSVPHTKHEATLKPSGPSGIIISFIFVICLVVVAAVKAADAAVEAEADAAAAAAKRQAW